MSFTEIQNPVNQQLPGSPKTDSDNGELIFIDDEAGDDLLIMDDEGAAGPSVATPEPYPVLVVDDEPNVHEATLLMLRKFRHRGRALAFESAFSGKEAREKMTGKHYALVLLDVVMETDHAGLETVDYIRKELKNSQTRIILRTGQPGLAPEDSVISRYDIDDYRAKTDLTLQKMNTAITGALRAYDEIMRVEDLVQERTRELAATTEQLREKHESLNDSLRYAKRIQTAILPSVDYILKYLPNFVVYYRPKDVVSGDFFFFSQVHEASIIANIDCTGHGVPGAIMSVFAFNILNELVNNQLLTDPEEILTMMDLRFQDSMHTEAGSDTDLKDGMELSILTIDHGKNKVHFGSANRPLFHLRNCTLLEIEGSKNVIGDQMGEKAPYETITIDVQPGDRFFTFTDGMVDQFGGQHSGEGDRERKFSKRRLKEILQETCSLNLEDQVAKLTTEFEAWKDTAEQTDDISFIGLQPF